MGKLNLTPAELTSITNSMQQMKDALDDAARDLKNNTTSIQSKWDDDAFEIFQEKMVGFHKQLKDMADQLEREKNRVKRYQDDTSKSHEGYKNYDF